MRPLPEDPVFDRATARAAGWSDAAISRAARSGRVLQVRRGVFCRPDALDEWTAAVAVTHSRAHTVISHRSALLMHGLPVVGRRPSVPEITVLPSGTGSAHAAHLHRASFEPSDLVEIGGAPVLSVARTLVDVGRSCSTALAVAAIDAALHAEVVTPEDLYDVARRQWNWPGIRRARRALSLSDGRAESPLESVSRLVIRWMRLPTPELQTVVTDRYGCVLGRLDFYWDEYGVAGEADGRSKYDGREVLTAEKERQELLEDQRLVFVRWGWDQAVYHPKRLRMRLQRGFERGLARDRSGLPRAWSVRQR